MKPDSSRKTKVALRLSAFFLDAGSPPCARARSRPLSAPARGSRASVRSRRAFGRESSERDPHGSPLRSSVRSGASLGGKSRDRFASRRLSHLLRAAFRAHAPGTPTGNEAGPDEASDRARRRLPELSSASGSPSLGSIRPFWRPPFGYDPPSVMPQRDVSASRAPLHFLLVSWAGRISNAPRGFNRNAGVNRRWG